MNNFRFKQFTINQDCCGMKVGTDGVLLGAWAETYNRILDIGTGTGLIALMMAQRNNDALITGIEIDAEAAAQATENCKASPWADRINIVHGRIQDYYPTTQFDLIVSNPPYFINSMKSPDSQRAIARNADSLPIKELMKAAARLISQNGRLAVIVPVETYKEIQRYAAIYGFFTIRQTNVRTNKEKPVKRILIEYSLKRPELTLYNEVCLFSETTPSEYSTWYKKLTKDFYLDD